MRSSVRNIVFLVLLIFIASCSSSVRFSKEYSDRKTETNTTGNKQNTEAKLDGQSGEVTGKTFRGLASYYADKFTGRTTASGEIYLPDKFTAAHKTLKFGTKLRVTNVQNSNTVIVVVNDRGPNLPDRMIDLSKAAAIMLDMIDSGIAEVEIEIID